MHDYIKERTLRISTYLIETRKTVRVIAKEFGVSKSTVHKDLTERLSKINPTLALEVKEILEYHKSIRHLRGGEATREKYSSIEEDSTEENTKSSANEVHQTKTMLLNPESDKRAFT